MTRRVMRYGAGGRQRDSNASTVRGRPEHSSTNRWTIQAQTSTESRYTNRTLEYRHLTHQPLLMYLSPRCLAEKQLGYRHSR